MMTNTYIWKSIFEWPQKISDREYMLSLDGMVLQRISDAYIKIYDTMKSEKIENLEDLTSETLRDSYYSEDFENSFEEPFIDFNLIENLRRVSRTAAITPQLRRNTKYGRCKTCLKGLNSTYIRVGEKSLLKKTDYIH